MLVAGHSPDKVPRPARFEASCLADREGKAALSVEDTDRSPVARKSHAQRHEHLLLFQPAL